MPRCGQAVSTVRNICPSAEISTCHLLMVWKRMRHFGRHLYSLWEGFEMEPKHSTCIMLMMQWKVYKKHFLVDKIVKLQYLGGETFFIWDPKPYILTQACFFTVILCFYHKCWCHTFPAPLFINTHRVAVGHHQPVWDEAGWDFPKYDIESFK